MNSLNPKTAEIYQALVDPPIEGEANSNPKANFQKIPACQRLGSQQLFSEIRFTEIKADMMDDPTISRQVKHRLQVASQRGSGTASLVVPTEKCLEMDDDATVHAICQCCRLGLAIPGLHMRTRCRPNCTQMGPHAVMTDRTVRENIITGVHRDFLGCRSCDGTYDRHNPARGQVTQVALAYLRYELKFTGSASSVDSNYVGTSADGKSTGKHTLADGQVWGSLSWRK
jgi:hypothetical protein